VIEVAQFFRLPPHQRVFALNSGKGLNGMGAADRLCAHFTKTAMFYLTSRIKSFTVPATSSIGTLGSKRCW
jgi:hypothetical protein